MDAWVDWRCFMRPCVHSLYDDSTVAYKQAALNAIAYLQKVRLQHWNSTRSIAELLSRLDTVRTRKIVKLHTDSNSYPDSPQPGNKPVRELPELLLANEVNFLVRFTLICRSDWKSCWCGCGQWQSPVILWSLNISCIVTHQDSPNACVTLALPLGIFEHVWCQAAAKDLSPCWLRW